MRIGAYQFCVTGDIDNNYEGIEYAVKEAARENVRLLVFPECALTGYPPRDFSGLSKIDFEKLKVIFDKLQELSNLYHMYIFVGTVSKAEKSFYNTSMIFSPFKEKQEYHKRALWGWDRDNFTAGEGDKIIEIDGWKIGICICFEVRFPEFFRELYKKHTDLNVIMFYDVSDYDDIERYQRIKAHIMTRAVENVTCTLAVNTISPFQTAPTILYGRSGQILQELERNRPALLLYELEKKELDFGELGRKEISDWLQARER